jgi:thioredoxin 1
MVNATEDTFAQLIGYEGQVIAYFTAPWCHACKKTTTLLTAFEGRYPKYKIVKIDIEECPKLSVKMNIQSIPTVIIFKDGYQKTRNVGSSLTMPKLINMLDQE